RPVEVDSPDYEPNRWRLYHMHGNVLQWCSDGYGRYPPDPVVDPQGTEGGVERVLRGGSWLALAEDCRCASRHKAKRTDTGNEYGFRVGCESQDAGRR